MGTSQIPLVLKSVHKNGQGTVSLQTRQLPTIIRQLPTITRQLPTITRQLSDNCRVWRETVPWPFLWTDFETKGTCEVPMTYRKF